MRSGDPDALDSIVPMAVSLDLVLEKKVVDVDLFYNTERLRPKYTRFVSWPLFVMTSQM